MIEKVKYTEPNWNRVAVLTIDMQNDFSLPGAAAEIGGTYEIIPQMRRVLEVCRQHRMPVIHVIRLYKEDGSNVDLCRREMIESGKRVVISGSTGADLVHEIKPLDAERLRYPDLLEGKIQTIADREWVMYKPRWGAFYRTGLEEFLRERTIDTLVFIGCNFPNCPRTSMYEASERDFRIVMIEDAVSGVYERGLEEMKNIGVHVMQTESFIHKIKSI